MGCGGAFLGDRMPCLMVLMCLLPVPSSILVSVLDPKLEQRLKTNVNISEQHKQYLVSLLQKLRETYLKVKRLRSDTDGWKTRVKDEFLTGRREGELFVRSQMDVNGRQETDFMETNLMV